jgi:hypothetical protein
MDPVINELWSELKRYINSVDRADAADTVVSVLIDNDSSAEDIRDAFRGDADIKRALVEYLDLDKQDDEDEDENYLDGLDDPDHRE